MKQLNNNLVICILPSREQVDSTRLNKALDILGYSPDVIDTEHPNRLIKEFCEQNSIKCIDLLPAFRNAEGNSLYFDIDPHFNKEGHRFTAEIIYTELINQIKLN